MQQSEESRADIEELRALILAEIVSSRLSIRRAAELSGTSVRSLQRRLAAAGTTYSRFVQEILHEEACRILCETDVPLTAIAAALGYSEVSAFSRAFRRLTGRSPSSFRTERRRRR